MADLAQALSEIKSLPDIALRHALSKPDGTIPGFLALSELHERKRVRASAGTPAERPSMAQEYMGMETARTGFASGGVVPKGMSALTNPNMMYYEAATNPRSMYNRPGKGGIVDLVQPGTPVDPSGLESLVPRMPNQPGMPDEPQHYAGGGIVGLRYMNQEATRNRMLDPNLERLMQEAVGAVYGPGYSLGVYSGGQSGDRRTGTHRHDDVGSGGRAGDVYVYDPQGNQLRGDALAPLGQYWRAKQYGGVGLEMHGGGVHLDELTPQQSGGGWNWNYADKGGQYTAAQKAAMEAGARGELPGLYGAVANGQGGTPDWTSIQNSIANIESAGSGGYSALGPETNGDRPYGRYQIMGNNIGPWTQQHLGTRMTADQFLANQQAQDAVFQGQFGQYINKYGLQGAAQAWLGGPGSVGNTGAKDILGTSVGDYGQRFMAGLNGSNPTAMAAAATSGASGAVAQAAANTGAEMAAADGGMGDFMMLAQLMGGGQKAPAPAMGGGAPPKPQAPINPEDMYRRGVTMPGMRRAYG